MNEMADKHIESSRIDMEDDLSEDEKMIESEDEESFFRDEGDL
jgi:hypothetical protein